MVCTRWRILSCSNLAAEKAMQVLGARRRQGLMGTQIEHSHGRPDGKCNPSQHRALFQQRLGYRCLGRWGDRDNSNIEQPCSMLAGQALRNLRTKRKWTQTDLALRADVWATMFEVGRNSPSVHDVSPLRCLDITPSDMLLRTSAVMRYREPCAAPSIAKRLRRSSGLLLSP